MVTITLITRAKPKHVLQRIYVLTKIDRNLLIVITYKYVRTKKSIIGTHTKYENVRLLVVEI